MNLSIPLRRCTLLAPLVLAFLSSTSTAARPASSDAWGMLYDEPGDGRLWARGEHYKASFGPEGAVFYAGFGPRAPSSAPHVLSPDRVTSGGIALEFAHARGATRMGDRVEFDRGSFREAYELAPGSLEQLFVFDTLPSRGDLVLHIPVASELAGAETEQGLEFRGELGRVTYSRAVAIDAAGRRASAVTRLENGAITIEVDAAFLATASLPVVIDPVVTGIWIDNTTDDTVAPDMCWDPFNGVWLATWEYKFSATDSDILVRMLSPSGATLASGLVDVTTASWQRPRVADNGSAHVFLVVAERTSSTPRTPVGRIVQPNGTILTMGAQITTIGGSTALDQVTPDVGGDPSPSGTTGFCVVFEHVLSSSDSEIGYRMVSAAGVPSGTVPIYFPDSSTERNRAPSISRSNGGSAWLLAWTHQYQLQASDGTLGARVGADGIKIGAQFGVSGVQLKFDETPCASSPLDNSQRYAVTFSRAGLGGQADIFVALLDGPTLVQTVNLTALENSGQQAQNQIEPSIDCDGQHFLVSYSEFKPPFNFYEVYSSDLYLAGDQLGLTQSHVVLHPGLGLDQRISRTAAARPPGAPGHRFGIPYQIRENDQDHDIALRLFDAFEGGSAGSFCFGDGSGTACPCSNSGASGRGCANSANAAGALLDMTGVPSTVDDTLALQLVGVPSTATCTFLQGSSAVAAVPFGDGLRCAGGTLVRLATKAAVGGASGYPQAGDPPISVRGSVPIGGGTFAYQVSYRDPASCCTSLTFNITNGVLVNWAR